jgi:hypothetical protein
MLAGAVRVELRGPGAGQRAVGLFLEQLVDQVVEAMGHGAVSRLKCGRHETPQA